MSDIDKPNPKILIIEDEVELAAMIEYTLSLKGYDVIKAFTGEDGIRLAETEGPDLIILDINLPKMDGHEVCRIIRLTMSVPILMLTVNRTDTELIKGLEGGADDYLTKPFNYRELILRIQIILKRSGVLVIPNQIILGGLKINMENREVRLDDQPINLSPTEFRLISCLAEADGAVVPWETILKKVWDYDDWESGPDLIKVHIRRLRKKIEPAPSNPRYIKTVRGFGYKLVGYP